MSVSEKETLGILKKLSRTFDIETLLDLLAEEMNKFDTLSFAIYLPDSKKENLLITRYKEKEEYKALQKNVVSNFTFSLNSSNPFAQCFNSKEILLIAEKDFNNYDENVKRSFLYWNFKFIACIPFKFENEIIGIAALIHNNEIETSKIEKFEAILHLFYQPVKNALEVSELKIKEREILNFYSKNEKLLEIAEHINNLNSLENVYRIIIQELTQIFKFDGGSIFLKNESKLELAYAFNLDEKYNYTTELLKKFMEDIDGYDLGMQDAIITYFFLNNIHSFLYDFQAIKNSAYISDKDKKIIALNPNLRSRLFMPIRKNKIPIGMVSLISYEYCVNLSETDIKIIEALCSFIGTAIENSKLYSLVESQKAELEEKERIISEDLFMAKRIQQNVISNDYKKIKDLKFFIRYQPQSEIGGDIYDITEIRPGYCRIFIADATGHGIQASLTTMIIKNEYDMVKSNNSSPDVILGNLNKSFYQKYFHLTVFFTSAIVDIDKINQKIYFSSAGHPDQYLVSRNKFSTFPSCGKLIGIFENTKYNFLEADYEKGDKLVLFTDGLYETFSPEGEEFGDERLCETVKSVSHYPIDEMGNKIFSTLDEFSHHHSFDDDVTVIGVEL